jgi:hypothetical protein
VTFTTCPIPVGHRHDLIGEATVLNAILDQAVRDAHRIQLAAIRSLK